MSTDAKFSRWKYLKSDYYTKADTIEEAYPILLKQTPELQHAVNMVKIGEAAIDKIMTDLADKEDDE